jgi:hypothetical protein
MLGVATKPAPLKLVLAFDVHVSHNHGKHLFMNVNSRYPIRYKLLLAGAESVSQVTLNWVAGYRRSPQGERQCPFIRSTMHAPDQTHRQPRLLHCWERSRRSEPCHIVFNFEQFS